MMTATLLSMNDPRFFRHIVPVDVEPAQLFS
jgi:hypothetical protein